MLAGWIVLAFRSRDVGAKGAQGRFPREGPGPLATGHGRGVPAGGQAGGDGFHVALHAGNLAREEDARLLPQLQRGGEQRRRVDICVAVDLPEAQELRPLQAGDQPKDASLLGILQRVLEAHQVVAGGAQVLLAQLHDGVGPAAGARVAEAHGLHGAKSQRVAAAARQFLDGQAGFEVRNIAGDVRLRGAELRAARPRTVRTAAGRRGS